ncbi:MAG: winged helix-turn-helix transcriptional regulator [Candidatus Krumholzibacteriota bacterium]|nr:winged helix-turn-helix transcriptional regulator [Candidatus Krumholzibacteriota bacterium]
MDKDKGNNKVSVSFYRIAKRLKAIAEPSRLSIIQTLCDGEKNVTELISSTGFSQASVSKHLGILRAEELVEWRRDNKNVYYRLKNMMPKEICNIICRSIEDDLHKGKEMLEDYWRTDDE